MITAKIYKNDEPNANGLIYPREELVQAVNEFNLSISNHITFENYPPEKMIIDIGKIAGITTLSIVDEYVVATINFLHTPEGARAEDVFNDCGLTLMPTATGVLNDYDKIIREMSIVTLTFVPVGCIDTGETDPSLYTITKTT